MAGNYRNTNESAHKRAWKHNLWLRYNNAWYTPTEFNQIFGSGFSSKMGPVELLNPIPFLKKGREIIERMILDGKPANEIANAFKRLNAFEDKLRLSGYREWDERQPAGAKWPDN